LKLQEVAALRANLRSTTAQLETCRSNELELIQRVAATEQTLAAARSELVEKLEALELQNQLVSWRFIPNTQGNKAWMACMHAQQLDLGTSCLA
jgi:hypothetical protein